MSWASVVKLELIWSLVEGNGIKVRHHVVDLKDLGVVFRGVIGTEIKLLEDLLLLLLAEDLLDDAEWHIILWRPWLELSYDVLSNGDVNVNLILETMELLEPSS